MREPLHKTTVYTPEGNVSHIRYWADMTYEQKAQKISCYSHGINLKHIHSLYGELIFIDEAPLDFDYESPSIPDFI